MCRGKLGMKLALLVIFALFIPGKLPAAPSSKKVIKHRLQITDRSPSPVIFARSLNMYLKNTYISKETLCILCVHFWVVNEYVAHLTFQCVKLNKGRLRCTEII